MTIDEIKELYKMIAERDDSIGDLISKIADKDKRISELEAECRNSYNAGITVGEKERLRLGGRILELEATVEKLKRCGNCTHFMIDDRRALYCENDVYPFPIFGKCDKWEAK